MFRNMKTVSIILALFLLGPLIGAEYGGDGHSIQTYALVHEPKQVDRSLDSREERSLRIKEGYYDRTKKKNTPAAGNRKKENINTKQLREKTPDTPKAKSIAKDITDSTNSVKKVYTWEEVKKIIGRLSLCLSFPTEVCLKADRRFEECRWFEAALFE